jgi:anti-sigma B factor antagonist
LIAAAACHRCPTLLVERGDAPVLPDACPNCGAPFAATARSRRPDEGPVAFALHAGDKVVLGLQGELDLLVRRELLGAVDAALDPPPGGLLVDLTDVTFADSTVMTTLVRAERLVNGGGGRIACVAPAGAAQRIFQVAGLEPHIRLHPTREDALKALS